MRPKVPPLILEFERDMVELRKRVQAMQRAGVSADDRKTFVNKEMARLTDKFMPGLKKPN